MLLQHNLVITHVTIAYYSGALVVILGQIVPNLDHIFLI